MTMTSTYDHRIIQGAESGRFLAVIESLLAGEEGFYENAFEAFGLVPGAAPERPVAAPPRPPPQPRRPARRGRADDAGSAGRHDLRRPRAQPRPSRSTRRPARQ